MALEWHVLTGKLTDLTPTITLIWLFIVFYLMQWWLTFSPWLDRTSFLDGTTNTEPLILIPSDVNRLWFNKSGAGTLLELVSNLVQDGRELTHQQPLLNIMQMNKVVRMADSHNILGKPISELFNLFFVKFRHLLTIFFRDVPFIEPFDETQFKFVLIVPVICLGFNDDSFILLLSLTLLLSLVFFF